MIPSPQQWAAMHSEAHIRGTLSDLRSLLSRTRRPSLAAQVRASIQRGEHRLDEIRDIPTTGGARKKPLDQRVADAREFLGLAPTSEQQAIKARAEASKEALYGKR